MLMKKLELRSGIQGLVLGTIMALMLSLPWASQSQAASKTIRMGTASSVGGWYVLGGGICALIEKHVPGVIATPQVTGGSGENMRLLANGNLELIMVGGVTSQLALKKIKPFENEDHSNLRGLFSFESTYLHLVVRDESPITSYKDLKGRRVAVGPPGSGTEVVARLVLAAHGLGPENLKYMPLGFSDMYSALEDKSIDAFFLNATPPGPALVDLSRSHKLRLIPMSKDMEEKLCKEYPAFFPNTVPAGTYKGIDNDVESLSAASFIAARSNFEEALAYDIVKAVYMYRQELLTVHASAKNIVLERAIDGIPAQLHPGAVRYYKEVGHPKIQAHQ